MIKGAVVKDLGKSALPGAVRRGSTTNPDSQPPLLSSCETGPTCVWAHSGNVHMLMVWLGQPLEIELELELIQTRMAQKPLLWIEVGWGARG